MDMRKDYEELRKALDLSSANNNNVLQPQVLSQVITEFVRIVPTVRSYIKRIDWPTMAYNFDARVTPGAASSAADGAVIPFTDSSFLRGTQQLGQYYRAFQITNASRRGASAFTDLVADELGAAMKSLLRFEDKTILQGDVVSGNPGLLNAVTNTFGASGQTITHALLDSIETAQNVAGYEVDAYFVSKGIYSLLKTVAFNSVRFTNITPESEIMIGYSQSPTRALMFNGKPVVLNVNMYNGGENVLAVSLDPSNLITVSNLEPIVEDFQSVQPQFDGSSFRIKEYCTTVLKNPNSAVLLKNVVIPAIASF